jgi:hypothetical protein
MSGSEATKEYWFNTKTNQVEVGKKSIAVYRIGPFTSYAEAENALEILAAKSKSWRESDKDED